MPKKGYKQSAEHKDKCRLKRLGKDNGMYGKHAKHSLNCTCSFCRAERGELSGKNNHMYRKGYLISGKKNGNFIEKVPFACLRCGKIKYTLPKYAVIAKYCSLACNYAAGRSKETKKNIKIAMHKPDVRKRHIEGLSKNLCFKDTSIELKMQNILRENNIKFEKQKPLLKKYIVDIFIKPNIVIECDGDYWHNRPGAQERDKLRNVNLTNAGYKVLRFWEHEINDNINLCFSRLQKHCYIC